MKQQFGTLRVLAFAPSLVALSCGRAAETARASSQGIDTQVTALESILMKDPRYDRVALLANFETLRVDLEHKEYDNALNLMQRFQHVSATANDPEQEAVVKLATSLASAGAEDKVEAAAAAQKLLEHAAEVIRAAKEPKDLDSLVNELQEAVDQSRISYSRDHEIIFPRLDSANRFVKEWQNYLVDKTAGDHQKSANDLRALSDRENGFMPFPRSKLLELSQEEEASMPGFPTRPQVGLSASNAQKSSVPNAGVETPMELHAFTDIPTVIGKLEAIQRSGGYGMELNDVMNSLRNLQSAYVSYENRNYAGALQQLNNPMGSGGGFATFGPGGAQANGNYGALHSEILELKDTLALDVIRELLQMPGLPAPEKDEAASDYLLRLAQMKEKAGDWAALRDVLDVYQRSMATYNPAPWLVEDLGGLHAYLVGERLEGAGQYLDAIRAYRQALSTLGRFFPADPAGRKLGELQGKYPALYKEALELPIAPRSGVGGG